MRSRFQPICVFAAGFALVALFASPTATLAQDDLEAQFERAAESFRPVTEEELAGARREVLDRMVAVERFVRPNTANGERWLRYLRWESLEDALAAEGRPDPRPLAETYRRLNRDEEGLERPQFRRLADSLRGYLQLLNVARQPDQTAYYRSQIERLQTQLADYRREPTAQLSFEIGSRLGFLADLGEAPELVAAVRREFAQPNAYVTVATPLIAAGADPINRREWVNDCILGTDIRSDTQTFGRIGVRSVPSRDRAVLEFVSNGRTLAKSIGRNGPAVIHSSSETDFSAVKRVVLSDDGFRSDPAQANARTCSNIHSVSKAGGGLGSRLVSAIGSRRAEQDRPQAEAIAARNAEGRIEGRFNQELNEEVGDARRMYEEEYRRPLARRGELPERIRFSSDRRSVSVEATQASRAQLGASGAPPQALTGYDLIARLHQSAINNYSAIVLSGATVSQSELGQDLQWDVKLPDWMKGAWSDRQAEDEDAADAEFRPWSLRFREARPLSVRFVDGRVELTVHIAQLRSGERTFTDWDVTGIYTPELTNGGVTLHRDEDLVMLPAGFRGTLSTRQVAERRNLEEELNRRSEHGGGFPRTIELGPLEPEGALADAGPLDAREFLSENGWLTLAWNRQNRGR